MKISVEKVQKGGGGVAKPPQPRLHWGPKENLRCKTADTSVAFAPIMINMRHREIERGTGFS